MLHHREGRRKEYCTTVGSEGLDGGMVVTSGRAKGTTTESLDGAARDLNRTSAPARSTTEAPPTLPPQAAVDGRLLACAAPKKERKEDSRGRRPDLVFWRVPSPAPAAVLAASALGAAAPYCCLQSEAPGREKMKLLGLGLPAARGFYSSGNHARPSDRFRQSRLVADLAGQNRPRRVRGFSA